MDNTTANKIAELKTLNEQSNLINAKIQPLQKKVDEMVKAKKINEMQTNTDRLIAKLKPWMEVLEVCNLKRVEIPLFDFYKIFLTKTSIEVDKYFSFSNDKWIDVEYINSDSKKWVEFWTHYADPTDLFEMPFYIIESELEKELLPRLDSYIESVKRVIAEREQRIVALEDYIASQT